MKRRKFIVSILIVGLGLVSNIHAQEVALKLHHFLPPQANIPQKFFTPWAEKIAKESKGRIKIQLFPAMQLGGRPPALFDQAKDGMVDISWTLTGYTPNRFVKSEVFELPFIAASAEATSKAAWEFYEQHLQDEYKDVKVLAVHTHGPGLIHSKGKVASLKDLEGMKLRGPTRQVNKLLKSLGATPVGMPIPAAPSALAKGVIDGVVIPWEVVPSFKIPELVGNHTGFKGDRGLYTSFFVLAMNKARYEALPDDLKKVIDNNSGANIAGLMGQIMDAGDDIGLKMTQKTKNKISTLSLKETARWRKVSQGVVDGWISDMKQRGIDGGALYSSAKKLIAKHAGNP